MPKHPDFQKIYDAFMWRYCQDHKECDVGKNYYYGWLKNMGLDDTKPYQRPQERFSWIEPYFKYLKEDEHAKYFKVEALFPLTSMNNNIYTEEELLRGTRTLIGKTPNWNHTPQMAPEVQVYDAEYEGSCAECLLRVLKDSRALREIETGNVVHVSVEIDCLRGSEWTPEGSTCAGLVFTGLALLTKDVLPGVPLTRIMPVEKLVESFTVTDVTKMSEQNNSNPPPQTNPPPETPPPPGTSPPEPPRKQEAAGVGDYELKEQLAHMEIRLKAFESELDQLKKPKDLPKEEPKKEQPCKCVLTKEGFWARFHQLRQEGASKSEAFRLVSLEVIEAASKKA